MHAVRTQCARSAKFWMSANTRTLVLAPFHKFLVPYKGFFGFPSIQDVAYLNCQPLPPNFLPRKLFRQVTELMVTKDHEFVGNSTSPPFAFLSYPFHMGISLPLGKRLTRVFWAT